MAELSIHLHIIICFDYCIQSWIVSKVNRFWVPKGSWCYFDFIPLRLRFPVGFFLTIKHTIQGILGGNKRAVEVAKAVLNLAKDIVALLDQLFSEGLVVSNGIPQAHAVIDIRLVLEDLIATFFFFL